MANLKELIEASTDIVHPNPWNYNKQSDRVQEATRESIAQFGFIDPVTVRPHPDLKGQYQIVDGEHRWRAAVDLGVEKIALAVINVTDVEAKKLTIILNETRGSGDKVDLASLIAEISDELGDDLVTGLPYSDEELEGLLKLTEFDMGGFAAAPDPVVDPLDQWETIHIRVPAAVVELWERARENVEDGEPHSDLPVRNGLALESILADFLA